MADDGRFLVVWAGRGPGDQQGIFAQWHDPEGHRVGPETRVNTTTGGAQVEPVVAMAADGSSVVVWSGVGVGDVDGVFLQRYAADGTRLGSEQRVNTTTLHAQAQPSVAMNSEGQFLVTWSSRHQDGSDWGVFGQRFQTDGTRLGGEFRVNDEVEGSQFESSVAIDELGRGVVAWRGYDAVRGIWGIDARWFDADGQPLTGDVPIRWDASGIQRAPKVAMTPGGAAVISWTGGVPDGSGWEVYGRVFDVQREPSATFQVNRTTAGHASGHQQYSAVAMTSGATALFVWSGRGEEDREGVFRDEWDLGIEDDRPPVITPILDQTTPEEVLFELQVEATNPGRDAGDLRYELLTAPVGAEISPLTGLISWIPDESQGPGIYLFTVQATDVTQPELAAGLSSFYVWVEEVNLPPQLAPISDRTVTAGTVVQLQAEAYDPDLPPNLLTFQLDTGVAVGGSIDALTGEFNFVAPEVEEQTEFLFTVRVTDDGVPSLHDTTSFVVTVLPTAACVFADGLPGWEVFESGGTDAGRGAVTVADCQVTITEGDSFVVGLQHTFTIPEEPTAIQFTYDELNFDATAPEFIKDAFEVALVDQDGNALVAPFTTGRDAFFNVTEGVGTAVAEGVVVEGNTVTVGLNGLPPGTEATLIFRLANNDLDTRSTVRLMDLQFVSSALSAKPPLGPSGENTFLRLPELAVSSGAPAVQNLPPSAQRSVGMPGHWAADVPADVFSSITFATSEEFQQGVLFNLNTLDVPDRLSLNRTGELEIFPFIWISNSGDGTVSKFDTRTGEELGRYRTGPESLEWWLSPSRTAVASDGSVWVANRAFGMEGSIVKILHDDFVDRNGNGVADTSRDLNGNGQIDPDEILPWDSSGDGQPDDERIALVVAVGRDRQNPNTLISDAVPRSIALDADDNVWVGLWNLSQYEVYDGQTGELLEIVPTTGWPYGAVIDAHGILWGATRESFVERIDTTTRTNLGSISHGGDNYGITLGPDGIIWTATFGGQQLIRINPETGDIDQYDVPFGNLRGVAVDNDGNVWVASSSDDRLIKFEFESDGRTLTRTTSVVVGSQPTAAVIDADGFVWTTTLGDDRAYKIDPISESVVAEWPIPTGHYPYNYSDMTGHVRLTVTGRSGTWSETIDAGRAGAAWAGVEIDAALPETTSLGLRVRSADEPSQLSAQPWSQVAPNEPLPPIAGRFLEIELRLSSRDNEQHPTIDRVTVQSARPPVVAVSQPLPGERRESGVMLLSGQARADQPYVGGAVFPNQIIFVTINDTPVERLDPAGNFFSQIDILPGTNRFEVTAHDRYGQSATTTLYVEGIDPDSGLIDFTQFADITGSFSGAYFRTSFNETAKLLHTDLATRNDGQFPADVPLLIGVKNISDPSVSLVSFDGFTPEGIPYYDYSQRVPGGWLGPGQFTESPTIRFHNPERVQFDYELVFYGQLNRPPEFNSLPRLEAFPDRDYRYDVTAVDPDNDPLRFSLLVAPESMSIDAQSGELRWTPGAEELGNHPVQIRVADGRGGLAEQAFHVAVIPAPPNRPPVITSEPLTHAVVAQPPEFEPTYHYDVVAFDPDDDLLTYGLVMAPDGMQIDPATGLIHWAPDASQLGDHQIIVQVSDGRGGMAEQSYVVCVHSHPDNRDPVILSEPLTVVPAGAQYHYQVFAVDPDGDELRFELAQSPDAMSVDAESGLVTWPVVDATLEEAAVWLRVLDGRGGMAEQQFVLRITTELPGAIRGTKIHDLDGDGRRNFVSDPDMVLEPSTTLVISPEFADHYTPYSLGPVPGVPLNYGGVTFAPWDLNVLLIGGNANQASGAIYAIRLKRGADGYIVGYDGVAEKVFDAPYNDGGVVFHPSGVLFTSRWPVNQLGQILPGSTEPDKVIDLTPLGVASSHAALLIPEEGFPGFGTVKLVSYGGGQWYEGELVPDGMGTFDLVNVTHIPDSRLTTGPEGLVFVPRGSVLFDEDHILVAEYGVNAVSAYRVDERGNPIPASRRVLMTGLGGAEGAVIDPLTGDFLFSTFRHSHQVAIIRGFQAPSPAEPGLEDWIVYLDLNDNGRRDPWEPYTHTDADGNYVFTDLAPGTYTVREEMKPGWRQTFPAFSVGGEGHIVELASDQIVSGIDFLNEPFDTVGRVPPSFISTVPSHATANHLFRYDAVAVSANNLRMNYSLSARPDGMTVHPTLGTVVWIPGEEHLGDHQVVLRATDEDGFSVVQTFMVAVGRPNTPPVITSTPPSAAVADRPWEYRLRAQDADGDPISYRLFDEPAGMTIDPQAGVISWIPDSEQLGNQAFAVVADDGQGGETIQPVVLQVLDTAPNQPPRITSQPWQRAIVGNPHDQLIQASDPDGDPLSFQLDTHPPGMSIDEQGLISWLPPQPGSFPVAVRVSDGRGGEAVLEYTLTVASRLENRPPSIISTPRMVAVADRPYELQMQAIDPDGDPLLWSLVSGPRGMSIDPQTGGIHWTPDSSQLGMHIVAVQAQDPLLAADIQRFTVEVRCHNMAPNLTSIPPTTALVDRPYFYAVRAEDPEGDPLTFSLLEAPAGMSIDPQTGLIRWIPTLGQLGLQQVVLQASDGQAAGTQRYAVQVGLATDPSDPADPDSSPLGNRAPVVTSTPRFLAEAGLLYAYQVTAVDPDGDAITFSLPAAPAGMAVDPQTGLIQWSPAPADEGEHLVNVVATDAHGAVGAQAFVVSVRINQPPEIVSSPVTSVTGGAVYRYTLRAIDPEDDPLTFWLEEGPSGMSVDARGRILWQTGLQDVGQHLVRVGVRDDRGGSDHQPFTLTVTPDTQPPEVRVGLVRVGLFLTGEVTADVGSALTFRVTATDNVAVAEQSLTVNGVPLALYADGQAFYTADEPGVLHLVATATDTSGNVGTGELIVSVRQPGESHRPTPADPGLPPHDGVFDPDDNQPPTVIITSPEPGTTVTNQVPIIGTVSDLEGNLWYYRAYHARADRVSITNIDLADPDWSVFHESTEEVIDGQLALLDTSNLENDAYAVVVAAFDKNGQGYIQPTLVYVEGNVIVGNFRLEFTDLAIPLAGIPIQVNRIYDTLRAGDEGDFGFGWTLGVQDARIFEAAAVGAGGAFNAGNDKFIPGRTKVYLNGPDGRRVGFTYQEELVSASFFGGMWRPYFEPDPGVYDTLTIDETQVARGGIIGALAQGINPSHYTLTTRDGLKYRYHDTLGLQTITDRNGNVVTFSDDGISHSSGESIQFVRDHRGRITEITAPDGSTIRYQYNAAGDLIRVVDQAGLETRYTYLNRPAHYLDEAYDSLGRRVLKAEYDNDNRFVGVIDALGERIDQREFDTANNTGIIRDGNGNPTTLIYDTRGNVLEETDPLGNTTYREYNDPRNPDLETRIIDRNGNLTDREYDARGNLMTIIERGSDARPLDPPVTTSFTYDTANNVTSLTNALGQTTRFVYDSQGNLTQIINALGDSSFFTYDSKGQRTSFTDFNGNVTRFEYTDACPCGSPSRVVYADDTYETFEYNRYGQITRQRTYEADGTLVQQQQTFYDSLGRVTRELIGGGSDPNHPPTDVRKFYNGHLLEWEIIVSPESLASDGTLLESPTTPVAQRKNRITEYRYDERDNLITQIDAMGGIVDFRYDAQGNRVLLRDPVGNITTWTYDVLNRVAEERDPFYWGEFVHANATLDTDALLAAVVEENEKPSTASLADNQGAPHVRSFAYDAEGNPSKTIDRNNRRREFAYDHAGRLLEERWYNPVDHAMAPGALVETITFTYDTLGNMLTAADSNSRYLHTYDVLNRLTSVDNNPLGDRDVPRVILTYAYDAQGNVISTSDDAGVTVASEYDSRNRLAIRRWFDALVPDGQDPDVADARVDFFYTAAGREREVRRYSDLDGTDLVGRTLRTYDLAGRSDQLLHVNAVNEVIAGYDYDYDFSGLLIIETRSHQDPQYAQEIEYQYDLTGQLVAAQFEKQDDEFYEYDLNGNRKSATIGDQTSTYAPPGPANQLTSDGTYDYEYDGEGNMVKRIDRTTGETRTFIFDHLNRLLRIDDWSQDPNDPNYPVPGAILVWRSTYSYDSAVGSTAYSLSVGEDAVLGPNEANLSGRDGNASLYLSRLVKVTVDPDGDGSEPHGILNIVYESQDAWVELASHEVLSRYLFGDAVDAGIARLSNDNNVDWYLGDSLGSVRDMLIAGAVASSQAVYRTFGQVVSRPVEFDRLSFTGRDLSNAGNIINFRTRWYLPEHGRFMSQDQLRFRASDMNLYRYAANSPTNATDPTGEMFVERALLHSRVLLQLFARGGTRVGSQASGAPGLFNGNNYVRIGLGWNNVVGCLVFRIAVGFAGGPVHWHLDLLRLRSTCI